MGPVGWGRREEKPKEVAMFPSNVFIVGATVGGGKRADDKFVAAEVSESATQRSWRETRMEQRIRTQRKEHRIEYTGSKYRKTEGKGERARVC